MSAYENEDDEELQGCFEGCCRIRCRNGNKVDTGPRCMCLPYKDPYMITAQVLAFPAFLCGWMWWVGLATGLISTIVLQLVWCCRPSRWLLMTSHALSLLTASLGLYSGVYQIMQPVKPYSCSVFLLDYGYEWVCKDVIIVNFVDAALWLGVAGCTIAFQCTGRYAKWEAHIVDLHNNNENENAKDVPMPESARPGSLPSTPIMERRALDEDEETEITTTTTINDGAFAPREIMDQMVDDDDDDDEEYDEEEAPVEISNKVE